MILVFNLGSASFQWAVFDEKLKEILREKVEYPDFSQLEGLTSEVLQKLASQKLEISVIGYRVVHGGIEFRQPVYLTKEVIKKLNTLSGLAPLHNPQTLKVIKICRKKLPDIKHIACFDTSFFCNIPDYARYYAIPLELTRRYQIFRYGFHGISHEYVANEAAKKLGEPLEKLKLITCHLGSGASMAAIEEGHPIDTTMGFTPLEGLIMATRCGDLDPDIPLFLLNQGLSVSEISEILNKKSGLLGISGVSGDMRELLKIIKKPPEDRSREDDLKAKRAGLALQMYAYKIKKTVGAFAVSLGGLDALVLTGAVAEGSELVRQMITHGLHNVLGGFETLTIPTDEQLAIARKVSAL